MRWNHQQSVRTCSLSILLTRGVRVTVRVCGWICFNTTRKQTTKNRRCHAIKKSWQDRYLAEYKRTGGRYLTDKVEIRDVPEIYLLPCNCALISHKCCHVQDTLKPCKRFLFRYRQTPDVFFFLLLEVVSSDEDWSKCNSSPTEVPFPPRWWSASVPLIGQKLHFQLLLSFSFCCSLFEFFEAITFL